MDNSKLLKKELNINFKKILKKTFKSETLLSNIGNLMETLKEN